jgi:hypothetical protein
MSMATWRLIIGTPNHHRLETLENCMKNIASHRDSLGICLVHHPMRHFLHEACDNPAIRAVTSTT